METLVYCRSEINYADRPLAITWQGQRLEISEIIGRWRTPQGWRFLIKTENQLVFELLYSLPEDAWQVTQK